MKKIIHHGTLLSPADVHAWLVDLRSQPHIPASQFAVSCIGRYQVGNDQTYYTAGVNVEYSDHRLATHGEEGSIAAALTAFGARATMVECWVMGAPQSEKTSDITITCCGKCRQQIASLARPDTLIHYTSLSGKAERQTTVADFLPDAFTLGSADTPAPLPSSITLTALEQKLYRITPQSDAQIKDWLMTLESRPLFSKTHQAAVLRFSNGAYSAGVLMEEAAFQSCNPVQMAFAIAAARFGAVTVTEAWTINTSHPEQPPQGLPLSALQCLYERADSQYIPLHFYNQCGDVKHATLSTALPFAPRL